MVIRSVDIRNCIYFHVYFFGKPSYAFQLETYKQGCHTKESSACERRNDDKNKRPSDPRSDSVGLKMIFTAFHSFS